MFKLSFSCPGLVQLNQVMDFEALFAFLIGLESRTSSIMLHFNTDTCVCFMLQSLVTTTFPSWLIDLNVSLRHAGVDADALVPEWTSLKALLYKRYTVCCPLSL